MAYVYFFVPNNEVKTIVECGLKLSDWSEKEITFGEQQKSCIVAYLNPKDDLEKYKSEELTCLCLDVKFQYCFVADAILSAIKDNNFDAELMYKESIVMAEDYIFGTYRKPECLITSTLLPNQISILDKRIDLPILFDNSEELFITNFIEISREKYKNFDDMSLYSFCLKLTQEGKATMIEDKTTGYSVFQIKNDDRYFTVKIPSFDLNSL